MKYIKRFNESTDTELEELEYFVKMAIAYILDNAEVQVMSNRFTPEYSIEINSGKYNPLKWSEIKDDMIPFILELSKRYEISEFISHVGNTELRKPNTIIGITTLSEKKYEIVTYYRLDEIEDIKGENIIHMQMYVKNTHTTFNTNTLKYE